MTTNHAPRNAAHPFAIVSSGILRNPDLSSVECRVISILLSLPQGWQPNVKHLSTQMREGTSAIQRAITRLKQMGYLVCRSFRDMAGRFLRTDWEINEIPVPPNARKMDVRGNIIAVDCGKKAPKNLRREAKHRVKSGQKLASKPQAEPLAAATFDPYTENPYTGNPNTGFSDRSNIDIPNIHPNLEREAGFGKQEEGEELDKNLGLCFDKSPQSFVQTSAFRSGKSSGAVESGYKPTDYSPLKKGETVVNESVAGNDELREFQSQLEDLGKRLGRKSPVAWAYTIAKNLSADKPCTYWEEFKAGIPLGTSEQREWEIAPGVACTIAIQCLQQDYLSRPGTTPQEAALKAARTIARSNEMAAVWESIKSQVMFRRSEWERQSDLGVQSPVLDSWMTPKAAVSVEEVTIALQEIQSALPEVLKSRSELSQPQQLQALQCQEKSALTQNDTGELLPTVGVVVEGVGCEVDSDTAAITAAAKAKIAAILSKFARPNKRAATLTANMEGVKNVATPVPVKASSPGGLADYLLQIEVEDDEIW